jgi:predicted HAD superfamily Cof-like phosphohydrolase
MANIDKVKMVTEFHKVNDANIGNNPCLPYDAERHLRRNLLQEEFNEYLAGEDNNDIVEIADALGDMLYIIYGTSISYGIPIDAIFEEIHSSNMSKLGTDGLPIRREDGKILKGPNYFRPNISGIIDAHHSENREEGDL